MSESASERVSESANWRIAIRPLLTVSLVTLLSLLPRSASPAPWHIFTFCDGSFYLLDLPPSPWITRPINQPSNQLPNQPPTWHITAAALADVTGDTAPEWVLLVWRPWRDWPIQRWSSAPSPIASFHDAAGQSCHLILLDPRDPSTRLRQAQPSGSEHRGREIWAGSALPAPLLALAVGDVDGDGRDEVVTLEGDYTTGRNGPATHVDVWRWNGFGFTLEWHSPSGTFRELRLTNADNDGILDITVR
ncbi:MAG: hypothetical protein ACE5OS_14430 [Anaerolineae bacterium]